ncbi:MAG TPA: hypothetical protein PLP50_11115 [Thermoanaerobaculia bacterium]|nr:hypothetical protein [Thermoanaerobaculia bacterium]HQN06014.1 hypothetical protein [Thermoanaerobaculia bacterium]HQP85037.1 hypothetical protein [Thermoanaerobaculia bacterium]
MRDRSVISSNVDVAAAISRSLAARRPGAPTGDEPRELYVRFERVVPAEASSPRPPAAEIGTWEAFLAWSLELTRAHAGFVVDSQGFVIASRGNTPKDGFEGIGAELCYAMDQLRRINPTGGELRLLELQFDANRLIGLRADAGAMGTILVGFQGTRSIGDDTRDTLLRQLGQVLPGLA